MVNILPLMFCRGYEVESWSSEMLKLFLFIILNFKFSRDDDVWLRFWSKCLVEILKMKLDQDLCLNLLYDPLGYFGKMNSTLGSVVPLAMFSSHTLLFMWPGACSDAIKLSTISGEIIWKGKLCVYDGIWYEIEKNTFSVI